MKQFYFLTLFACIFSNQLMAQQETKKQVLINTAKSFELKSRASFSAAIIKAKEKGWPISYKTGKNTTAQLVGIDNLGMPKYYVPFADPIQAITINANKVWIGGSLGYTLSGANTKITNTIGVWDEGKPRLTHKELVNRITHKDNSTTNSDHATHVAGIIMSKGLNPLSKGMAYGINGAWSYDWNNDESEMALAAANGLLISNHSYGIVSGWDYNSDSTRWEFNGRWNEKEDFKFGLYDESAQAFDSIAYNAPSYLIVKAAGNNRNDLGPSVGQPYWRRDENNKWYNAGNRPDSLSNNTSYETLPTDVNAKNILTVGAVNGIASGYNKKEDVVMTAFSVWGPTDDGRIKPDIVADGNSVYSTVSTNDSSYGAKSGTSMAAPGAAGALLLLQELSQQLTNKNITASTVKALAIHTANEAGLNNGPDYKFGWGLLNMSGAANSLSNALSSNNSSASNDLIFEGDLQNNETKNYTIIASGKTPIKATIVWTDVKGSASSLLDDQTPELVNDLDLVVKQGARTFLPWALNPLSPEEAASRKNNILDNVEKVELDSITLGATYTISITHKGILDRGHQNYSIIISGAGGAPYCNSTATSSVGTKIDSISINNINFLNNTTNGYIDNSNYMITAEPSGSINLYAKLGSADVTNYNRFLKVFIDYNNNGIFESAETVSTSAALLNGDFNTSITLSSNLIVGNLTKLRIVVMETTIASNVNACDSYAIGETQDYSLKIVKSSNDLQITEIVSPTGTMCKKDKQYVTIKIANNGSIAQSNIPLKLKITNGSTTILDIEEIFVGKLNGFETMNYTFQKSISIVPNNTYTISATVTLANDQQKDNNSYSDIITGAAEMIAPIGDAVICNSSLKLTVTNPVSSNNYFWYDNSNLKNPIAVGSAVNASTQSSKVYLAKGYQGLAGPETNTSLGSGGYNNFKGNYMKITTTMPVTINTAKLYTSNAGKIEFELMYMATDTTYFPGLSQFVTINAPASSPNPVAGASGFVAGDTGRIYELNFKLNVAGKYYLVARCDSTATLFRNNQASSNTYPIGPTKLFSYTGNSVNTADGNYQNYYYFFYNTQISTNDCYSPATEIAIKAAEKPSFALVGDSLVSTSASNYQWYMNEEAISGAINKNYKPVANAYYKVATFTGDCQNISDNKLILITDVAVGAGKEIKLKITSDDFVENIIKGNSFYVQFSNIQTQGISLEILNSNGNSLFVKENLNNQNTPQHITIPSLSTGIYFVKIYANKKVYIQRVLVTNN